ncbi:ASCH domain-containing protein [Zhihengliuella sp.]|uniref:ASCH domain-containing protein n=1 Tax=Zhihengliuella sp. TaxID=1954483 RepID=UPI00281283A5|nr:ASCH domain-containing protein [Zhihengliuella sp.]
MWRAYTAASAVVPRACDGGSREGAAGGGRVDDYTVEYFGDSPALADALLREVTHGAKRATATLELEFAEEGEPMPRIGSHWIACHGTGAPAVILRTTELRLAAFDDVDAAFAFDEGEDDRTLESWRREHERYWRRTRGAAGHEWSPEETARPGRGIVLERFAVVWPPDLAD